MKRLLAAFVVATVVLTICGTALADQKPIWVDSTGRAVRIK